MLIYNIPFRILSLSELLYGLYVWIAILKMIVWLLCIFIVIISSLLSSTNIIGMKKVLLLLILAIATHGCQPNCNDCSNSFCTACSAGYELTIDSQCLQETVTGCALYDNSGKCAACQPTFRLVDTVCEKQYDGCLKMQIDQTCSLCAFGKTLINSTCIGTLNCLEGMTNCTKCRDNFTLQDGACIDETQGCMIADSLAGVCVMCNLEYDLVGYQCINKTLKPNNCNIYNRNGACLVCKEGYIIDPLYRCVIPGNSICKQFDQNMNCLVCANQELSIVNGSCIDIHCKVGAPGNCQICEAGFSVKNGTVCSLVDPNCQSFSSQSVNRCETCKQGYYVDINGTCSKLPNNCVAANLITRECISCAPNYIMNPQGQCKPPIVIANCQQVNMASRTCSLCSSGYYVSGGNCAKVSTLCSGYDPSSGLCLKCKAGYINFGGRCLDTNCAQVSGDTCMKCKINFTPDPLSGACRYSDPNCASLSFLSCNACKPGFYLNPIVCAAYPPFCAQMKNDLSSCLTCKTGWSLINDQCVIPVVNCLNYAYNGSLSFCKSCVIDYQLVNSLCVFAPAAPLDKNCIAHNSSLCTQCSNRYYLLNQACVPVNPNCNNYSFDGNCTTCYDGYMVSNGNCILSASTNCKTFIDGSCTLCYSGYYIDTNTKMCVTISTLCKSSNSTNGLCLSCFIGYTLINGMCISTIKNPNCIQFNLNGQCISCSSRFFMKGTLCTPINPLCKTYNTTTGNCLSCYPGYYLSNGNCHVGINPATDDINCKLKDNTGKCLQCYSSYYLSSSSSCKLANPLCKSLDFNTGWCITCYVGYSIQSGNCVVSSANNSDPNCIKITSGVCTQCYTGFFVGGAGVCSRINTLCKTSNPSNGFCLSCYPGYTLFNGQCVIPQTYTLSVQDPYCIQRSGSGCTQCSTGYFPLSGVCQTVNPLCKSVDRGGSCTSCYNGYTIQNGNCVVLQDLNIPFCQTISNGYCIKCMQGYYNQSPLQCSPVSILCSSYDQNTGNCLSCITGYFLQVGQCIYPAMGFDRNCLNYEVSAYCSSCIPGYYLLNYVCARIDPFCVSFDANSQTCNKCGGGKSPSGAQCA